MELPTDQGVDAGDLGSLDLGPSDGALDLGLDADIPADADVDAGLTAILEVGFGSTADFMVAPGSGSAMAVMGVQGGYHLDMGFRIRGFTAEDFNSGDWIVRYAFRDSTGADLSEPISRVLSLTGITFDGIGQVRAGDRVFFSEFDPSGRDGDTITLFVSLTRDARVLMDTAEVTLLFP